MQDVTHGTDRCICSCSRHSSIIVVRLLLHRYSSYHFLLVSYIVSSILLFSTKNALAHVLIILDPDLTCWLARELNTPTSRRAIR